MHMALTPESRAALVDDIFSHSRIIPVIQITHLDDAIPLAQALVNGGLKVLEITLRSDVAVDAIEAIANHVEGALVGAGTVLNRQQFDAVVNAGAQFVISPGSSDELYNAAAGSSVPLIPGVATASEVMTGLSHGYSRFKFFPAVAAGGLTMLKAWQSPFADARFCPTGGITPTTATDFLIQSNVMGIGGSWMLKPELIEAGNWDALEALARDAKSLDARN